MSKAPVTATTHYRVVVTRAQILKALRTTRVIPSTVPLDAVICIYEKSNNVSIEWSVKQDTTP